MSVSSPRTPDEKAFAKVVSVYLWKRYEMALPESPGYVTQNILDVINDAGLTIQTIKGEPMDNITLIERAIREDIAGRIEDLCECITFSMPGCDHMKAASIARGDDK